MAKNIWKVLAVSKGVARAESELFDYLLKNEGLCYINLDDQWIESMSKRLPNKKTYSIEKEADVHYTATEVNPRISLSYHGNPIQSVLSGTYNYSNIITAIAIAEQHNIPKELIAKGISSYIPSNNRSEWKATEHNEILVDCYNANPSSMVLTIQNVLEMPNPEKLFIIGDMLEMGSFCRTGAHQHTQPSQTTCVHFDTFYFYRARVWQTKRRLCICVFLMTPANASLK